MPKLLVTDGEHRSVVDLSDRQLIVGRDPLSDVPLRTADVSRQHCRIEKRKDRFVLTDLESKNGTLVNGFLVREHALEAGDRIRVGESLLIFAEDADPAIQAFLEGSDDAATLTEETPDPETDDGAVAPPRPARGKPRPMVPYEGGIDEDGSTTVKVDVFGGAADGTGSIQSQLLRLALLAQTISSELDLDRLLGTILDTLIGFTGFERGMLLLFDDRRELKPKVTRSADGLELDDEAKKFSRSIVDEAVRRKNVVTIGDLTKDRWFKPSESYQELGIRAAVCMPLVVSTRAHRLSRKPPSGSERRRSRLPPSLHVIGAIYLESRAPISEYPELTREILQHAAAQAAIAIQNARLHYQATTDPLTGLYNRGYFEQLLEEEIRHSKPDGVPFSLMISDLDNFKKVNDTYGHAAGDEVLRRVAKTVREILRSEDIAGRYGGEEFVYVLPGTLPAQARTVAEKIRRATNELRYSVPGLSVTLSLGIASFPLHGRDAATLLKRADQALYRSKIEGRDRYAVWDDSLDRVGWRADPLAGILTGNLARDHRNVQILLETIDLVRSAADFNSVVARAMDYILEFTGAARVLLFQTDPAGALELANARLRGGVSAEPMDLKYSRSVPDTAVQERRSMCIIDSADGLSGPIVRSTSMDSLRLKTVMCVPLEMREECVGAIYVDDKIANKEFKQEDLVFLEAIAKQLGMAIASREAVSSSGAFRAPWSEGGPPPSRAHRVEMDALRLENERLRQKLADHGLEAD